MEDLQDTRFMDGEAATKLDWEKRMSEEKARIQTLSEQPVNTKFATDKSDFPNYTWQEDAACRNKYDLYFAPDLETFGERKKREARAAQICGKCVVREQCFQFAYDNAERYGIWAEGTEREKVPVAALKDRSLILT